MMKKLANLRLAYSDLKVDEYLTAIRDNRYFFHLGRNGASPTSCRERNGKRSALKEDDAVTGYIGDEGGVPLLQSA